MQTRGKIDSDTSSAGAAAHRKPPVVKVLFILVLLGAVCVGGYYWWKGMLVKGSNLLVSGRIEGYETNVGAKIGGRVNYVKYREGAPVTTGELIVKISDDDIQAQLRGAEARQKQAQRQEDQAVAQIKVIESQIEEAKLNWKVSKEDTAGRVLQAQANVAAAQSQLSESIAQLQQAEADLQLAKTRQERYGRLVAKGAVTQDQYDQANTTHQTALSTTDSRRASVESAKKQLEAQQGLLTQALTTRMNPPIRSAQLKALDGQLAVAEAQFNAAKQAVHNAAAAKDEIQANIAYLNIESPINGIVTARPVEPGVVVVAGQTVLSVIDLNKVYLRGYVPEGEIGKVRVGQKARVYLDSAPNKPLDGSVIEVDPVASFTPENIYFKDDRVKQVFGIKIGITQPGGYCKPGMPADADIITGAE